MMIVSLKGYVEDDGGTKQHAFHWMIHGGRGLRENVGRARGSCRILEETLQMAANGRQHEFPARADICASLCRMAFMSPLNQFHLYSNEEKQ